ncbi:MAG: LPXTG cell wall anchor domain-containing protein [Christensenellaceae bacterium]|jgi:LPXTG-motif cell wall-anchored protein
MMKRRRIAILLSVLLVLLPLPLGSATAASGIVQVNTDKNSFLGEFANNEKVYKGLSAAETGLGEGNFVPGNLLEIDGNGMLVQLSASTSTGGLYQSKANIEVGNPGDTMQIRFSETATPVYSIALGVVAADFNENYVANEVIRITVNGTETFFHTTSATHADNDVLITSSQAPIASVDIVRESTTGTRYTGLSYLAMATEKVDVPAVPKIGAVDFDGTGYRVVTETQSLDGVDTYYSIDGGATWQTSSAVGGLAYDDTLTLAAKFGENGLVSDTLTTSVEDFFTLLIAKIEEVETATEDLEEGEGNGQYPSSVFALVAQLPTIKQIVSPGYTQGWEAPLTADARNSLIGVCKAFLADLPNMQIEIDASALTDLITAAEGIDTDLYTAGSVTALTGAIADAKALLLTPYTADEVSAMAMTLDAAYNGLIEKATLAVTYDASYGDTYAEVSFDKGATWVKAEGVLDIPETATEIWLREYNADIYYYGKEVLDGLLLSGSGWTGNLFISKYIPKMGNAFAGTCKITLSDAIKMENTYGALDVTYNEDGSITVRSSVEPKEQRALWAVIVDYYLYLDEDIDYTDITASPYAVTLHKSFLDKLAAGEHTIHFVIGDDQGIGHATGSFTLADDGGEEPSPSPSESPSEAPSGSPSGSPSDGSGSGKPSTGDDSATMLFIVMGVLAVVGLAIVMMVQKKRRVEE